MQERSHAALELVGLADRAKAKPSTFSGGMKRRLNIACALVHDPDVLLLDEPTAGVDPQSRNAIFDNLQALKARGKALLYTTHYMEEAERLADRIVVMARGRVVAEGTPATLGGRDRAAAVVTFSLPDGTPPPPVGAPDARGRVLIRPRHIPEDLAALAQWALGHDLPLADLAVRPPTLEDVYLELTR